MKHTFNKILLLLIPLLVLTGCQDDFLYVPGGPIPDGETEVAVEATFRDFTPALGTRSPGDALNKIEDLWMVIFDADQKFVEKRKIVGFKVEPVENKRPDGENSSEDKTARVTFKETIRNGYYFIYFVANQDLGGNDFETIQDLKLLPLNWNQTDVTKNAQMLGFLEDATVTDKAGQEKDGDNKFSAPKVGIRPGVRAHAWLTRAASKLTVAFNTTKLNENVYIYLKSITIKDIPRQCYLGADNNIGQDSHELTAGKKPEDVLHSEGETIYFKGAQKGHDAKNDHGKWPVIASGDSVFGLVSDLARNRPDDHRDLNGMSAENAVKLEHAANARALFFYENMQTPGQEGTESDKRQDVDGKGQVSYPDGTHSENKAWKDAKPFGTYVEIDGYYVNQGNKHPGQGAIKYRFMLGKDAITNYEAERNHHFALTLNFKGNANDVDFHIDYIEEAKPGLFVPDTTYVSYSYLQPGTVTLRATPKSGYVLSNLEAFLIENEWRPMEETGGDIYFRDAWDWQAYGSWPADANKADDGKGLYVNRRSILQSLSSNPEYDIYIKGTTESERKRNIEWGYLSLRKIYDVIKPLGGTNYTTSVPAGIRFFLQTQSSNKGLKYYRSYAAAIPSGDGSKTENETTDYNGEKHPDGEFTITRTTNQTNKEIDYIASVPIFTRAKTIDNIMVYGGANPYYMHHRKAKIKFRATYVKETDSNDTYQETDYTTCVQSQRIDNPRMIMRKENSTTPFTVKMAYLKRFDSHMDGLAMTIVDDEETVFEEVISRGPWSATIINDPNGLVQLSANGRVVSGEGGQVGGRTNTPVRFTYTPKTTTNEANPLCAIIRVLYHNNNCSHTILVRQGYGPIKITGQGASVSGISSTVPEIPCFNVFDKNTLCKSPLSVGSLFRRYSDLTYPIAESNNDKYNVGVNPPSSYAYTILGQSATIWDNIKSYKGSEYSKNAFLNMNLKNLRTGKSADYRLPEFNEIPYFGIYTVSGDDGIPTPMQKFMNQFYNAFGVAYADGATSTCLQAKAVRYSDPDNDGLENERGVCGIVIYNEVNASNFFLPLGATGHARRKSRNRMLYVSNPKPSSKESHGFMHYGSVDSKLNRAPGDNTDGDYYRPLAYDLMNQKGAAYWIQPGGSENKINAIDYNYGNFMSSFLSYDQISSGDYGYDALPIRPVLK